MAACYCCQPIRAELQCHSVFHLRWLALLCIEPQCVLVEVNLLPITVTLGRDGSRLLKSYQTCLCLSEGETVRLVLPIKFNSSETVKHLLLTHLSLNPLC